jgi:hypothetical protein
MQEEIKLGDTMILDRTNGIGGFARITLIGLGKACTPALAALPGAPCPECNATNDATVPRMPSGFKTVVDKDGWRH